MIQISKRPRSLLLMAKRTLRVEQRTRRRSSYIRTCTASRRIQRAVRCSRLLLVANALAGNAVMIGDVPSSDKRKHGRLCSGFLTVDARREERVVVLLQCICCFLIGSCSWEPVISKCCPNGFLNYIFHLRSSARQVWAMSDVLVVAETA